MSAVLETKVETTHVELPNLVVPLGRIIAPDSFELERQRIFGRAWLLATHAADMPKAGDYVERTFDVPKASVIIVRGEDGAIRAFHNICRHRGNRLVAAGIQPGYVRAQLAEFDVTKMTGAGGLYEVKLDVRYGVGNNLNPGDKVDIYSTHSSMGGNSYWHVFGMFYGPVHTSDASHVHLLPSDTSAHAEASANP